MRSFVEQGVGDVGHRVRDVFCLSWAAGWCHDLAVLETDVFQFGARAVVARSVDQAGVYGGLEQFVGPLCP